MLTQQTVQHHRSQVLPWVTDHVLLLATSRNSAANRGWMA